MCFSVPALLQELEAAKAKQRMGREAERWWVFVRKPQALANFTSSFASLLSAFPFAKSCHDE